MAKKNVETSVEEDIADALNEIENNDNEEVEEIIEDAEEPEEEAEEPVEEVEESKEEPEDTAPTVEEEPEVAQEALTDAPEIAPPQSWSREAKEEWKDIPPKAMEYINKREADIHQMFTRHDGELRMGRELKEVINPYMPIITGEGGTPATAVKDLLNTAYQLRTGTPEAKAALVHQIAEQYGVDMNMVYQQPQQDPAYTNLQNELNGLKQQITQQSTLQEQAEAANINAEVEAFAAKPENIYFEEVRAAMAPLLSSGQAQDIQEAYDMAIWSVPSVRADLLAKQETEKAAKRKADIAKKKQAASSVTGSPGTSTPKGSTNSKSLDEDLADAYDEIVGSKI